MELLETSNHKKAEDVAVGEQSNGEKRDELVQGVLRVEEDERSRGERTGSSAEDPNEKIWEQRTEQGANSL